MTIMSKRHSFLSKRLSFLFILVTYLSSPLTFDNDVSSDDDRRNFLAPEQSANEIYTLSILHSNEIPYLCPVIGSLVSLSTCRQFFNKGIF